MRGKLLWVLIASSLVPGCEALPELFPVVVDAALAKAGCPEVKARGVFENAELRAQLIETQQTVQFALPNKTNEDVYYPAETITLRPPFTDRTKFPGGSLRPTFPGTTTALPESGGGSGTQPGGTQTGGTAETQPPSNTPEWWCAFQTRSVPSCAGVEDEYDELLLGDVLVRPREYMTLRSDAITAGQFEAEQRGKFRLSAEHGGAGIALVHTNAGALVKLLYRWDDQSAVGPRGITVLGAVRYAASKPEEPLDLPVFRIEPGRGVDLDLTEGAESLPENADLWIAIDADGAEQLRAMNEAGAEFPISSLCDLS